MSSLKSKSEDWYAPREERWCYHVECEDEKRRISRNGEFYPFGLCTKPISSPMYAVVSHGYEHYIVHYLLPDRETAVAIMAALRWNLYEEYVETNLKESKDVLDIQTFFQEESYESFDVDVFDVGV